MTKSLRSCELGAERRLAKLEATRPRAPSQTAALASEIRALVARLADVSATLPQSRDQLVFEKWRLIHRYLHGVPFRDRPGIKRSAQWREALSRVRDLGDPELIDWICLQIEVAGNIERGVQDLRPREGGPCYLVLLEYAGNRKRKAMAILKWHLSAAAGGSYCVDSSFHARTEVILDAHGLRELDENGQPLPTDEPLART